MAREARLHGRFHSLPGGFERHLRRWQQVIAAGGKGHARIDRHRPVDQVKIQPRQAEIGEGASQRRCDVVASMGIAPELGGDPQLLPLHLAGFDGAAERLAHLWLVAVNAGTVDVAVAQPDGLPHRGPHFRWSRFPGAKPKQGHGVAIDEGGGAHGWRIARCGHLREPCLTRLLCSGICPGGELPAPNHG